MNKRNATLIKRETRRDSNDKYEYSLYVEESSHIASFRLPLYSVSINLTKENGKEQVSEITDAFSDKKKAVSFFDALVENMISPFNLSYIFESSL